MLVKMLTIIAGSSEEGVKYVTIYWSRWGGALLINIEYVEFPLLSMYLQKQTTWHRSHFQVEKEPLCEISFVKIPNTENKNKHFCKLHSISQMLMYLATLLRLKIKTMKINRYLEKKMTKV